MVRRHLAVGSIAVTGLALAGGGVASLAAAAGPVALALSVLGALLGLALVAGAGYLYRSDVRTSHTVRVAGWNLLGAVLLGTILALTVWGAGVSLPLFVVVDVLGVSAVAHVLIGYNDVRRIRAEDLARQRRTLAVVNRVTRHNLRNDTQILTARAEQLAAGVDDPDLRAAAETVREKSFELSTIHEQLQAFQTALDEDAPEGSVDLETAVEHVLADYRDSHPEGTFEVDVPSVAVRADGQLETALDNLVENAVEHGSTSPASHARQDADAPEDAVEHGSPDEVFVRVSATRDGREVALSVSDRGPGIPDDELAVLTGDREIDPLNHASGLGLWVVKTIVERYRGSVDFETSSRGTTVTLSLDAV